MSALQNNQFLLASGSPTDPTFPVQRSVRLRSSASAYFNRTPSVAGNQQKFTWSGWVKIGSIGTEMLLFDAGTGNTTDFRLDLVATGVLSVVSYNGAVYTTRVETSAVLRDPSAWYHIVFAIDTTQATASNRVLIYINGVLQTALSQTTYMAQNFSTYINSVVSHTIGRYAWAASGYLDGYLTEVNFIDGQQLTPSSFGGYNSGTGVWEPRKYTGTYGTNGFYLNFQDNSGATATTIGKDSSGNGNNWTPNNISVTAGVTYDSMLDVPTLTSATNANFPVLNVVAGLGNGTYSDGNLAYLNGVAATWKSGVGSMGATSGKYYFEYTIAAVSNSSNFYLGVAGSTYNGFASYLGRTSDSWAFQWNGTSSVKTNNDVSTTVSTAGSISVNNVIQVAIDLGTGSIWWGRNNTWVQGDPSAGTGASFTNLTGTILPAFAVYSNGGDKIAANFGQRPFTYTPPTGFKSLNTYNLPDPTIASGDDYHKVYTYTGNGGGLQVGEIQKPMSLYNLDRSLRFKGTNSYFDKVFASGGANTKGTISMWVKRSKLGVQQELFRFGTTGTLFSGLLFNASDQLAFLRLNSTYQVNLVTTRVFKDPSLWYHIVVAWDTTLATASDRVKIYVNGIQETVFTSATYPTQNLDMYFFTAGTHNIGRYPVGGNYFGGYMAEFHAVDGQQLTASSFGQFDGNYYWTPKDYTGGYGTNGWHLDFEDYSSMSATGIGKDVSGLGNNFTPYNFNVTTPADTNANWDSMVDVPTLNSADVANYCTLNPLRSFVSGSAATFTNGNLNVSIPAVANPPRNVTSTLDVFSGKWYWEVIAGTVASNFVTGIASTTINFNASIFVAGSYLYDATTGNKNIGGTASAYGATYTTNDVIGIALDMDAGTLTFYKNGVSQGVAVTGLQGLTVTPVIAASGSSAITGTFNFGQRPFRYSNYGTDRPDATFKPINSFNVAEVTGDLESPDFVWIKSRSAATGHALFNSVTGVGKYLSSNATTAETTDVNSLIQFNKNGFLLGNAAIVNTSAATYVASAWKGGGAAVTNTAGSITSQVSANQKAGFSVVTFTNVPINASTYTIGHGLSVAPSFIVIKNRDLVDAWYCYHSSLGNAAYIILNSTAARVTGVGTWGSTSPTSSVFSLVGNALANSTSQRLLAYCFSEIAGFSKFGSYTGNGSTDGPFVYLGFRPRFIMIKHYIGGIGQSWSLHDTTRNTYNPHTMRTQAESTNAENTNASNNIDVLSNGFKIRTADNEYNNASYSYIYAAFAEHPFKYSLAR